MALIRLHTLLALIGLLLATAAPVAAQDDPVGNRGLQMRVQAAFDGWYDSGQWVELQVELTNSGPSRTAELRVTPSGTRTTYAVPVELPQGAQKLVPVLALVRSENVNVVLRSENGGLLLERTHRLREKRDEFIAAVVSDEEVKLPGLPWSGGSRRAVRIDVPVRALPADALALGPVDLMVVAGADLSGLTEEQRRGLHGWVALGGRLIVTGGPSIGVTLSSLDSELRPADSEGVRELSDLGPLAQYVGSEIPDAQSVVAELEPTDGSTTPVVAADGLPLVVVREVGDGTVTALAFDTTSGAFTAWAVPDLLWRQLSGVSTRAGYGLEMPWVGALSAGVSSLPEFELPSLGWTVLVLGFYILLVGPVNYVVLRRRRRLDLAWVTIPGLTIIATLAMYGFGSWIHGTDLVVYELSVVRVARGGEAAHVRTFVGLYSPGSRQYDATVGAGFGHAVGDPDGYSSGYVMSPVTAVQGRESGIRNLQVDQWSLGGFATEAIVPWTSTSFGTLAAGSSRLQGQLRNPFGVAVSDAQLVHAGTSVWLGDLAPGDQQWVSTSERSHTSLRVATGQASGASSRDPDAATLRASMLQAVADPAADPVSYRYAPRSYSSAIAPPMVTVPPLEGAYVIAWSENSALEIDVGGPRAKRISQTLYFAEVPIKGSQSALGYVTGEVVGVDEDSDRFCEYHGVVIPHGESSAEVHFSLDPEEPFPERLWLGILKLYEHPLELTVSVYYHGQEEPVEVGRLNGDRSLEIPDAARAVEPTTGRVAIKLESEEPLATTGYPYPNLGGAYMGGYFEEQLCGLVRLFFHSPTLSELQLPGTRY